MRLRVQLISAGLLVAILSLSAMAQKPMPNFDFEKVVRSGRPVVANFWATYCKPCIQEMPDLARLQKRWGKRVLVLGVNVEQPRDEQVVKNFVQRSVMNYPVIFNSSAIFDKYGGQAIPLTLIFDGKGNVIARQVGARTDFAAWLTSHLTPLLDKGRRANQPEADARDRAQWRRRSRGREY